MRRDFLEPAGQLLPAGELPTGFRYPAATRSRFDGLRRRYPSRALVPFARRQDNDDVACFDVDRGGVAVIRDFAELGWKQRAQYADVHAWLQQAVDDLIDFGPAGE